MNAKERLIKALEACLETTPIDAIKISDITQKADISRQTFYRFYTSKFDLLDEFFALKAENSWDGVTTPTEIHAATIETLTYYKTHENITRNMFFSKDTYALKHHLRNSCVNSNIKLWGSLGVDVEDEMILGALKLYSYGTASYLLDWVKAGCPGDVEEVAKQFTLAVPVVFFSDDSIESPLSLFR